MGRAIRAMRAGLAAGLLLCFVAAAAADVDEAAEAADAAGAQPGQQAREAGPDAAEANARAEPKREVAYLGVTAQPLGATLRAQLDLPEGVGLSVAYVVPESPADRAGLKRHDVLYKLDDQLLVSVYQSKVLVRLHGPGGEATFEVIRRGKPRSIPVTFGSRMVRAEAGALTPPEPGAASAMGGGDETAAPNAWGNPGNRAVTISTRQMSFTDGEHKLIVREDRQGRYLRAVNRAGDVLYEGYLGEGVEEELSPTLQRKLDRLEEIQRRYPVSQRGVQSPGAADPGASNEPTGEVAE